MGAGRGTWGPLGGLQGSSGVTRPGPARSRLPPATVRQGARGRTDPTAAPPSSSTAHVMEMWVMGHLPQAYSRSIQRLPDTFICSTAEKQGGALSEPVGLQVRLLASTQSPPDSLEIQGLLESPCPGMSHMGHDSPIACPRHRNHSLHLYVPPQPAAASTSYMLPHCTPRAGC